MNQERHNIALQGVLAAASPLLRPLERGRYAPFDAAPHVLCDGRCDQKLVLAADARSATARCACRVEREADFAGGSTLEQMARFQGQGSHRFAEERVLATEFVKGRQGWRIAAARFV